MSTLSLMWGPDSVLSSVLNKIVSVASKIGASSARLYYNGTNLLTLTDFDGFDPEVPNGGALLLGFYTGQYPSSSVSSIGLNIKF